MRYSDRREAVYEAVRAVKCHPDAEWVYGAVREKIPSISLGTVYRNLRELSESGKLVTLETESGVLRFDADTSPHAHFVCRVCGEVSDLYDCGDCRHSLESAGYTVESLKTVAYGVCPHCRASHNN